MTLDPSTIPGVTVPSVNTICTRITDNSQWKVTTVDRANFNGIVYAFACTMVDNATGLTSRLFQVWLDETVTPNIWRCDSYIPVRYRDEDGVKKGL